MFCGLFALSYGLTDHPVFLIFNPLKREFRREIFTPDQVQRLDEVDRIIVDEKRREEDYVAGASAIKNSPNLSEKEKEKKIRELQDETFGGEADAFRRREAIRAGTEEHLEKRLKR